MTSQQAYEKINQILINSDVKYKEAQQILEIFKALNDELVKAQTKEEQDADI